MVGVCFAGLEAIKDSFEKYIDSVEKPSATGFVKSLKLPNPSPSFKSELMTFYGKLLKEHVQ